MSSAMQRAARRGSSQALTEAHDVGEWNRRSIDDDADARDLPDAATHSLVITTKARDALGARGLVREVHEDGSPEMARPRLSGRIVDSG